MTLFDRLRCFQRFGQSESAKIRSKPGLTFGDANNHTKSKYAYLPVLRVGRISAVRLFRLGPPESRGNPSSPIRFCGSHQAETLFLQNPKINQLYQNSLASAKGLQTFLKTFLIKKYPSPPHILNQNVV